MSGDGYALGQPVRVTGFVTRARLGNRRWWARASITHPERQSGIVVGRRTLSDGIVDQEYDTDFFGMRVVDTVYRAEAYFTGWLVVRDVREKPIMVLGDDIRPDPIGGETMMGRSRWDRLAFWLETTWLRRWVMKPHGVGPVGPRYINRLNGHVVTGGDR